LKPKFYLDS